MRSCHLNNAIKKHLLVLCLLLQFFACDAKNDAATTEDGVAISNPADSEKAQGKNLTQCPPTNLGWQQSSPSGSRSATAVWTRSSCSELMNQKIQFYSDTSCTIALGVELDLNSADIESKEFVHTSDGALSYKIISINDTTEAFTSECSESIYVYQPILSMALTVEPYFPTAGVNWNDYVQGATVATASDTACIAANTTPCLHAGELKKVRLSGINNCAGLSINDNLDAFNWICDDSGGTAVFYSTGLKFGRHLSDLIHIDGDKFKNNHVTVTVAATGETKSTADTSWWNNPFAGVPAPDPATLSSANTIYVVQSNLTKTSIDINANTAALVVMPGYSIKTSNAAALISVTSNDFVWIEGDFNGDKIPTSKAIYLSGVRFSRLDKVRVILATVGVELLNSRHNYISDTFVTAYSQFGSGFQLNGSTNNVFYRTAAANGDHGFYFGNDSNSNIVVWSNVAHNNSYGVYYYDSNNGVSTHITSDHNQEGMTYGSPLSLTELGNDHTAANILAANNSSTEMFFGDQAADNTVVHNLAAIDEAGGNQIFVGDGLGNDFFGLVYVFSANCFTFGGSNMDDNCDPTTAAFVTTTGKTVSTSYVAASSAVAFDSLTATDWLPGSMFESWGHETANNCTTGVNCKKWNHALLGSDTMVLNQLPCPTGAVVIGHNFNPGMVTFLKTALELNGYGGNNNGLCETGEICLVTPNFGAYQGHGNLVSASETVTNTAICPDIGTGASVESVTLLKYDTNGY